MHHGEEMTTKLVVKEFFFYSRGHRWKIQDHVLKSFENQKITVLFRLTYYNIFALIVFLVCRILFKVKCNLHHISLTNNCWKKIYSQTYFQRPLRGNLKSGHLRLDRWPLIPGSMKNYVKQCINTNESNSMYYNNNRFI